MSRERYKPNKRPGTYLLSAAKATVYQEHKSDKFNGGFYMENTINQFDPSRIRNDLMRMVSALSVDALEYVWKPIVYANFLTDEHNPDALSDEDSERFSLIGSVAHDSLEIVRSINDWKIAIKRRRWEESRKKA